MKNILIVGATGNLGPYLVKELTSQGHQVSALVRSQTLKNPDKMRLLKESGVRIIEGDLMNLQQLEKACTNQEVVVSAVGGGQILQQVDLAKAAKKAGVERFIPSEFGVDPIAAGQGVCDLFDAKALVQTQIRAIGIALTPIYTNGFMEFWGTGLGQLGVTNPPDTVQVYGSGNTNAYMVSLTDISKYTQAIINDSSTLNRDVIIRANKINQNNLINIWEQLSGKRVHKIPVSKGELDRTIESSNTPESMMQRIFTQLHKSVWINGDCMIERPDVLLAEELYPQIRPIKLEEYFLQFVKINAFMNQ